MLLEPMIVSLKADDLFALHDETGQVIGTGTREVCEVLLYLLKNCGVDPVRPTRSPSPRSERPNVRSAMRI